MFNFNFYNPTQIVFGKDRLKELDRLVPEGANVLILYGGGSVKKFGTLQMVKDSLGKRNVFEFDGIEPNPRFETLMKAVDVVKKEGIDFLLAVGGGSVMDGTKFIAMASCYGGDDASRLLTDRREAMSVKVDIPMGTVVTLPATGSEMNNGAVISYDKGKFAIFNQGVFPVFSILDPSLTFTLPATQVANGIVDTFVHTAEQYMTFPVDGRLQDRMSEGIFQTLVEIGNKTIENPQDYDARANLVWCATMGLNGLIACGVPQDWTAHMIGHELTAMFGIDHGKTLAALLPAIWHTRRKEKMDKLVQYAERVWGITGDDEYKVDEAIKRTRDFFEGLGIMTRLSDYGIKESDIPAVLDALERHGMTALSETSDVDIEVSGKILRAAL